MKKNLVYLFIFILIGAKPLFATCAMSSANYEIYADSIDAGGNLMQSGSYSLESTFGESPAGPSDFIGSNTYEILAGYQYMERGYLSMLISSNIINLNTLSTSTVNSDSTVVTISTNSASGYSLSISNVTGTAIEAVNDGEVTPGNEEYGFSASGSDSQVTGDVEVKPVLVAGSSSSVSSSDTTLTFKASISDSTAEGTYNQSITLTAVANI